MVDRLAVWTTPIVWTDGQLLDEDTMNEQVRNNLLFLKEGQLSVVKFHPTDGWATPAYTVNAAESAVAVDSNKLTVGITVETTARLFFCCRLPTRHTSSGLSVNYFVLRDKVTGEYVSTGTTTQNQQAWVVPTHSSGADATFSVFVALGLKDPGRYDYDLYWRTAGGGNALELRLDLFPGEMWLLAS